MGTQNVYDTLADRGFIQQVTYPEELKNRLGKEQVTFYVGFDPTADSLHAGHLMAIMGMVHLQRAGHRPIAVVGGGTAMVGDPSGKSEMRKMLTRDQIVENSQQIKKQLNVSSATIASVAESMQKKPQGFILALKNLQAETWANKTVKKITSVLGI